MYNIKCHKKTCILNIHWNCTELLEIYRILSSECKTTEIYFMTKNIAYALTGKKRYRCFNLRSLMSP